VRVVTHLRYPRSYDAYAGAVRRRSGALATADPEVTAIRAAKTVAARCHDRLRKVSQSPSEEDGMR